MMKLKFKTRQDIDDHYSKLGLDIQALNNEHEAVKIVLHKSEIDAEEFVKFKLGSITYFFWNFFTPKPIGLGIDSKHKSKAKELGWEDTFEYPKEFK